MTFAENLKNILYIKRVTQTELSKRTGISKSIISEYVHSRYEPKMDNLKKIAAALGVSLSDLTDTEIPSSSTTPPSKDTTAHPDNKPEHETDYYNDPATAELAERLKNGDMGVRMLFDASRDATPEELMQVAKMIQAFKKGRS